jgi:hypothetical protein
MRVAMLAVMMSGLLGAGSSHAQLRQTAESVTFAGSVPAVALNNPGFAVPELTMPALAGKTLARGSRMSSPMPGATPPLMPAPQRLALRTVSPRVASSSNSTLHTIRGARPPSRSMTDHLLAGVVGLMLIAYQLRRKHRVLRPHPFST